LVGFALEEIYDISFGQKTLEPPALLSLIPSSFRPAGACVPTSPAAGPFSHSRLPGSPGAKPHRASYLPVQAIHFPVARSG